MIKGPARWRQWEELRKQGNQFQAGWSPNPYPHQLSIPQWHIKVPENNKEVSFILSLKTITETTTP